MIFQRKWKWSVERELANPYNKEEDCSFDDIVMKKKEEDWLINIVDWNKDIIVYNLVSGIDGETVYNLVSGRLHYIC